MRKHLLMLGICLPDFSLKHSREREEERERDEGKKTKRHRHSEISAALLFSFDGNFKLNSGNEVDNEHLDLVQEVHKWPQEVEVEVGKEGGRVSLSLSCRFFQL